MVEVTATNDDTNYVQLKLRGKRSGGDWYTLDVTEPFFDTNSPSSPIDTNYTDNTIARETMIASSKIDDWRQFVLQILRKGNNTNVRGRVMSFYIKVLRFGGS